MKQKKICIIGLGYVGLTLAVVLCEKNFLVYGTEKNNDIVNKLKNHKQAHFFEKNLDKFLDKFLEKKLFISKTIPANQKFDYFIITVGTPINKETKKPQLDFIKNATQQIAKALKGEETIILRSTVAIGTTREIIYPLLKKTGKKFYLAFCPERTTEGVALKELKELPQIIGGLNEESVDKAMDIFRKVTPTTVEVATLEDAEMNKMLDNAYRDLTFACANEIALIAKKLGMDGYNLIKAGNLGYPRTNIPKPGFVGGACLEKDPWILIDCVLQKTGYLPKLIKTAREINEQLPWHVTETIKETLTTKNINNKTCKLFISGFAFKGSPPTNDLRGSPTLNLLKILKENNFNNIYGHDFVVKPKELLNIGVQPVDIEQGFADADAVIFMNNHPDYEDLNIEKLILTMKKNGLFFDGWHFYDPPSINELNHVIYKGIGV